MIKKLLLVLPILALTFLSGYFINELLNKQVLVENIDVNKTIALVNSDVGILDEESDEYTNFASYYIENLFKEDEYKYNTVSLIEATNGLKSGTYSAYIEFPSDFSSNIKSIETDKPYQSYINYKINTSLEEPDKKNVEANILLKTSSVDNDVNYLYTLNYYETLNTVQNDVDEISEVEVDEQNIIETYENELQISLTKYQTDVKEEEQQINSNMNKRYGEISLNSVAPFKIDNTTTDYTYSEEFTNQTNYNLTIDEQMKSSMMGTYYDKFSNISGLNSNSNCNEVIYTNLTNECNSNFYSATQTDINTTINSYFNYNSRDTSGNIIWNEGSKYSNEVFNRDVKNILASETLNSDNTYTDPYYNTINNYYVEVETQLETKSSTSSDFDYENEKIKLEENAALLIKNNFIETCTDEITDYKTASKLQIYACEYASTVREYNIITSYTSNIMNTQVESQINNILTPFEMTLNETQDDEGNIIKTYSGDGVSLFDFETLQSDIDLKIEEQNESFNHIVETEKNNIDTYSSDLIVENNSQTEKSIGEQFNNINESHESFNTLMSNSFGGTCNACYNFNSINDTSSLSETFDNTITQYSTVNSRLNQNYDETLKPFYQLNSQYNVNGTVNSSHVDLISDPVNAVKIDNNSKALTKTITELRKKDYILVIILVILLLLLLILYTVGERYAKRHS